MQKQVKQLVDLSGLTNPELKAATVAAVLKNGIKRPIAKLISLVGHPCAQEQIEKINTAFKTKYDRYESQGMLDEIGISKTNEQELIDSTAGMVAPIIGEGFDIAFKDNLQINSVTGAVTVKRDPATGKPDSRFLGCAAAEVSLEVPKGSESDPYKGSQQGLGRTRKHKRRAKKTLRRRKVRRNMH